MKIIYIHQYFTTVNMSGGGRSFEMAKRLVRNGHEVHMITSQREESKGKSTWLETEEEGVKIHWFPVFYSKEMPYRDRIKAFLKFAFIAARRAAMIGGDVVFASSTPLTVAIPAVYASRRNRIPMVFEIRDLWPKVPIEIGALRNPVAIIAARWLELLAYRNSRLIVALSEGMKEGIISTGYPEDKVIVIPNGCDLELFSIDVEDARILRYQYEWLQERPLVIHAGAIGLVNGVEYLPLIASAVSELDPDIRFLVIGTGVNEKKVRRRAEELGVLNSNFYMMSPVPKSEIPYWLAAADISICFAADFEFLKDYWLYSQNKFFDALAAGKPIAINYDGWQADLLLGNDAGLVLNTGDIRSSADSLAKAIHDREWLHSAGAASRQLAELYFDRDKLAAQLEEVLERAVAKSN